MFRSSIPLELIFVDSGEYGFGFILLYVIDINTRLGERNIHAFTYMPYTQTQIH